MKKYIINLKNLTLTSKLSLLVAVLLIIVIFITVGNALNKQEERTHATGASPLLFGTNVLLNNASDQFITSVQTRAALQQINVQTIRMSIHSVGSPSATEIQAAQDIKAMNAVPLVVLNPLQTDPQAAAIAVVQAMNQIFGNSPVYYEFGSKPDTTGADQTAYTNKWNQSIPQIKATAINGKFGGPGISMSNSSYISYFVHNAIPKPDFISWDEFTCGSSDPGQICISNIHNWAKHISDTKAAIQTNGDTVPQIFISEWNYDENYQSGDPRATVQFQQLFTQTALQELTNDGVTAAYQYVATNNAGTQLVDPYSNVTAEGQTFSQMYTQIITNNGALSATPGVSGVPTITPTALPTPTSPFVSPTLYCLGNCFANTPTPTPTEAAPTPTEVTPSTTTTPTPSTVLTNAPTITVNPCGNSTQAATKHHDSDQKEDKKEINLLRQILDLLKGVFGQPSPTPTETPIPTETPVPTTINPCPTATPAQPGITATPLPSTVISALPSATTEPCQSTQSVTAIQEVTHHKKHHSHKNNNSNNTALIEQLLEIFKLLINLINKLIGLSPIPTATPVPTEVPTPTTPINPCPTATSAPSQAPTNTPIPTLTASPSSNPTSLPTSTPTIMLTATPTVIPTTAATNTPVPSEIATATPTMTESPTLTPTPTTTPNNDNRIKRLIEAFLRWLQRIIDFIMKLFRIEHDNNPSAPVPTIALPTVNPSNVPTLVPSCLPRPACLDQHPACAIPEPAGGWCPVSQVPTIPLPSGVVPPGCHYETKLCSTACVANGPCPVPCGFNLVCSNPTPAH